MAAIVINISNSKKVGLTEVKRKITINGHQKDYVDSVYTIPYLLRYRCMPNMSQGTKKTSI
mgnify:CR=1 FL=1